MNTQVQTSPESERLVSAAAHERASGGAAASASDQESERLVSAAAHERASGGAAASASDQERLRRFGEAIDAVRVRVEAKIGEEDVAYFRRLDRFSKTMEVVGRSLIHFSFEPVGFFAGVGALWLHKQLQTEEIGHAVMHGIFDHLPYASEFHSKTYAYDSPVDEESWANNHSPRHHANANVVGRDDNIHFGILRVTEHTPWRWYHRFQVPYALFVLAPNFTFMTNIHITGLNDLIFGNGRHDKFDIIPDRSLATVKLVFKRAFRKYVPYYAKEYGLYPLLAGPFFPKVLLGNWMAETMRDLWLAATIYSGHIANVTVYPEGTRAKGRGSYYAMQAEATNNFAAGRFVSVMSGGLDCHIEHHLFPHFPPNRIREIQPEIQAICEAHGVRYNRSSTWRGLLKKAFARMQELSRPTAAERLAAS
jgi:fatty acid desaturase